MRDIKVVLISGNPEKKVEINTENIIWGVHIKSRQDEYPD
jgi:hypothetical protein